LIQNGLPNTLEGKFNMAQIDTVCKVVAQIERDLKRNDYTCLEELLSQVPDELLIMFLKGEQPLQLIDAKGGF